MNTKRVVFVALLIVGLLTVKQGYSQGKSTKGKDFWFGFMDNKDNPTNPYSAFHVYITTDVNANCKITYPGTSDNFTVYAGTTQDLTVPISVVMNNSSENITDKAIHIESDVAVSVFILNYNVNSSDAAIVFPTPSLGNEYYTVSIAPPVPFETKKESEFLIIGVEDSTKIEITPSVQTWNGMPADLPFDITLNKGQAYMVKSQLDLTGTYIKIKEGLCKRFAVFSGNRWDGLPYGYCCYNHLLEQMTPVNTWGKKFITSPYKTRSADLFRVIASKDGTDVKINGLLVSTLAKGKFYETILSSANVIESNNPICVAQFSMSRDYDNVSDGDPFMILLSPVEQAINHIVFNSFTSLYITAYYLNLVTTTNNINLITLDGNNISSNFSVVGADPKYSFAQIDVSQGNHILNSDSGFVAYVYGYGGVESYGYVAGTVIENLMHRCKIVYDGDTVLSKEFSKIVCAGETVGFISTEDPNVIEYSWSFGDNSPIKTGINANHIYTKLGKYTIGLTLKNGCDSDYVEAYINVRAPIITIAGNTGICRKDTLTLNISGANTYIWSPATGLSDVYGTTVKVYPTVSTTYTIHGTNSKNCSTDTSFVVEVSNIKNDMSTVKDKLCFGDTMKIVALTKDGIEPYIYKWSDGSISSEKVIINNNTLTKTQVTYSVLITDKVNCKDSAEVSFYLLPSIKTVITKSDTLCPKQCDGKIEMKVTDSESIDDTGGTICKYIWNNGLAKKDLDSLCPGKYIVTITDINKCKDIENVIIPSYPKLTLHIKPANPMYCKGDSVVLTVSGAKTYIWSPNSGLSDTTGNTVTAKPEKTTKYTIKTNDNIGCLVDTSFNVVVSDIQTIIFKFKDKICYGDTLKIEAVCKNGIKPYSYNWSSGKTTSGFILTNDNDSLKTEYFKVNILDSLTCRDSASFKIDYLRSIKFKSQSDTVCPGYCDGKITLKVTDSDGNVDDNGLLCKYSWNNNANTKDLTDLCDGLYKVKVEDKNNCTVIRDSIIVPEIFIDTTYSASPLQGSAPLKVLFSYSGTNNNFEWNLGDKNNNNNIVYDRNTEYTYNYDPSNSKDGKTIYYVTLTIKNKNCSDTLKMIIEVKSTGKIDTIYNIISTNTKNRFCVKGEGLKSFNIKIFNRWGVEVFSEPELKYQEGTEPSVVWDGSKAADGTYFYLLQATTFEGKVLPLKRGNISVFINK